MRQKLNDGRSRKFLVIAGLLAVVGINLLGTSGDVFADQRKCQTMTFESSSGNPSMTLCAVTDDDGIMKSGLEVSYGNDFNVAKQDNPNYNGSVTVGDGSVTVVSLQGGTRGGGESYSTSSTEVSFEYGSTNFEDFASSVFNNNYAGSYTYLTEDASSAGYQVAITNCASDHITGTGCEEGTYDVIETTQGVAGNAYIFEVNGNRLTLSCPTSESRPAGDCGSGNMPLPPEETEAEGVTYNKTISEVTTSPVDAEGEEGEDGDEEDDPCYSNSGAMGWIMCPIISGASDALQDLYEDVLQDFLQIDPALLSSEDQGTYEAWNIFRNLANVALIIIFLVVIISQLTGYGINNYGIKKMLPRLVVLAILINLSYVACQLLVDLSNIIGASLHTFLNSIADDLHSAIKINGEPAGTGAANLLTAILGVGGAAVLGVGIATGLIGWAIIIPILVAVVAAVLAVVFMFVLLGIRQAVIVLLVALSPILIVLYILPNTQNVAKRGLNLFTGLLMMFPLAGLLIGGCHLASAILLTSATGASTYDWLIQILAVLLLVVPFFLLPWLVKSTFAAADSLMGKVVARGQGITGNLRGRAGGAVANTERMRQAEQRRMERRGIRLQGVRQRSSQKSLANAQKAQEKALAKADKASKALASGNLNGLQKRWYTRQQQAATSQAVMAGAMVGRAERQAQEEADIMVAQQFAGKSAKDVKAAISDGLASGSFDTTTGQNRLNAMTSMLSNMGGPGVKEMQSLMDSTIASGNTGDLAKLSKALNPGVSKQLKDTSITAGEMAKAIVTSNGNAIDTAKLQQDIAKANNEASAAKIANQSSDAIAAALDAGYISEAKAREIVENPDLRGKITGNESDQNSNISRLKAIAWPPEKVAAAKRQAQNQTGGENGDNNVILIPHGDAELNQATRQFRQDADQARRNRRK